LPLQAGFAEGVRDLLRHRVKRDIGIEETQIPEYLKSLYSYHARGDEQFGETQPASEISLSLSLEGELIELRISDDGIGFNPAEVNSKASAPDSASIHAERAELSGGEFEIKSVPGVGTTVSVAWKWISFPHRLPRLLKP